MSTPHPAPVQPPASLWDAIPAIVNRLKNEFLLVSVAYLIIVVAVGVFAPGVVTLLGRGFFYLIVVLGWLAYLVGRVLPTYARLRQQAAPPPPQQQPQEQPQEPQPAPPPPQEQPQEPQPTPPPIPSGDLRDAYLKSLIHECCRARLAGLDPQAADPIQGSRLSLERLYVALDTLTRVEEEPGRRDRKERKAFEVMEQEKPPLSALEALARAPQGRAVFVGLPGSGKSTFVRYLALRMAQSLRDPALNLADLLPGWTGRPLLPLIVPLGRLAESIPPGVQRGDARMVERFVSQTLDANPELHGYGDVLLATIRREGGLVLFDGLDEVANLDLRPLVRQAIEDFADAYGKNGATRFLVTCRKYSYTNDKWRLTGWPTHELAPLSRKKIQQFVDAWHGALAEIEPARAADYAAKREKMLQALDPADRRRLAEIAPNPLILTVMAVVHTHKGELPDARALVYEECIDLLLVRWELERAVVGQKSQKRSLLDALGVPRITLENALQEIAYRAHEGGGHRGLSADQAALVTEGLITDVLQAAFNDLDKVRTFLKYSESANGLLMLQGVAPLPDAPPDAPERRIYAFPHLSFEEYLAGRYLGRMSSPAAKVRKHLDRGDRWLEPVMLLGEHLCFRTGDFERVDAMLDKLAPEPAPAQPTPRDWRAVWLGGDLLLLYRRALQGLPPADERVVKRLAALVEAGALTPVERAAAARTLATLGDPRPGVGRLANPPHLPDIQWCLVPGGPFIMDSHEEDDPLAYDDETPQHERDVPYDYFIARYPVTNAQFQAFVDDPAGYRNPEWWTRAGLAWRKDRTGPNKRGGVFDLPNHPAVMITWYEAAAWCRWLTARVGESANPHWVVRLPTEAEWEKAARGGLQIPSQPIIIPTPYSLPPAPYSLLPNPYPARIYPWGNDPDPDRANYNETGIGTTSAVGCFPRGASPYGCLDMIGNVWEWCLTCWVDNYEKYDTIRDREEQEGDARRVVRGGAFVNNRLFVRCACGDWFDPDSLYWTLGFRPVAAPIRL